MTPDMERPAGECMRKNPVCELKAGGRYVCGRLSVGAVVPEGVGEARTYRARCPRHLPEGSPRFCVKCGERNTTRDEWRCGAHQAPTSIEAAEGST